MVGPFVSKLKRCGGATRHHLLEGHCLGVADSDLLSLPGSLPQEEQLHTEVHLLRPSPFSGEALGQPWIFNPGEERGPGAAQGWTVDQGQDTGGRSAGASSIKSNGV